MRKIIKKCFNKLGYDIKKLPKKQKRDMVKNCNYYEIYEYKKADGSFDYEKYQQVQTEGNKRKVDLVWTSEEQIEFLSKFIKKNMSKINFGLCHGSRNGKEQEWFRKYLECEVIGTEISDNAEIFPHTIQWDFHEVKQEWLNSVDFIYSNSIDHSYDPEKCLNAWMSCIKKNTGRCIIEFSHGNEVARELDPFGVHVSQMPYLVLKWGKGRYYVNEILVPEKKDSNREYLEYLVIKKI